MRQNPTDAGASAVQRYFNSTASLTADGRAAAVAAMVNIAKKHSLTAAGIFCPPEGAEGIFNSRGVADWYEHSLAEVSITMIGDTSSGWQKANSPDAALLDPARLAEIAAQKAIASQSPQDLPPGKYTVILEPAAVLDAVGFMFWDFGGSALLDQRSFLNERIGTQLFGENITVWDDVYHPLQTGPTFGRRRVDPSSFETDRQGHCATCTRSRGRVRRGWRGPISPVTWVLLLHWPRLRVAKRNRRSAAEYRL